MVWTRSAYSSLKQLGQQLTKTGEKENYEQNYSLCRKYHLGDYPFSFRCLVSLTDTFHDIN